MSKAPLLISLLVSVAASACTTTVTGEGGPAPRSFHVAVGAEVTLTLGDASCGDSSVPSLRGCLTSKGNRTLGGASLESGGAFSIVTSKVESNQVVVTLKANTAGATALLVDSTGSGTAAHDEFLLLAHEVTQVTASVGCQRAETRAAPARYPIVRGSPFTVELTAMAETTALLSGSLELVVNRGGLELLDPPARTPEARQRRAQAPPAPGSFVWTLLGPASTPVTFDVYDPASVGVHIVPDSAKRTVALRPAVNGVPACIYEGNAKVSVRASGSSCRLALGDFDVDGDLPVALHNGEASLEVRSTGGSCTLDANVLRGGSGSDHATFDLGPTPADNERNVGDPIGAAVERGGQLARLESCTRTKTISNGKCEAAVSIAGIPIIPDGDCFTDFEWAVEHYDGSVSSSSSSITSGDKGRILAGAATGVGLVTEMRVALSFKLLGGTLTNLVPNALKYGQAGSDMTSVGCDSRSNFESLSVKATAPGLATFQFTADNAPKPLNYAITVRNVAHATFLAESTDTRSTGEDVTTSRFFVGSSASLGPAYTDATGGVLRGIAPIRVSGTEGAGAKLQGDKTLFTGTTPNKITLASTVAKSTHVLDVVDISAVNGVGGLDSSTAREANVVCVEPHAKGDGQRIYGVSPVRPRVSFGGGDQCATDGSSLPPTAATPAARKLCFVVDPSGSSTEPTNVQISWGSATGTWACKKP